MCEKTKSQIIIEAAYEVFGNKGFQKARMEEIAEKAGVGKGTLYEYFKSKKDLYEEMYRWYIEKYFNSLGQNLDSQNTATDKIRIIIKNHLYHLHKAKNLFMRLEADHSCNMDLSPKIKVQLHNIYHNNFNEIKVIIETGINEGEFRNLDSSLAANFLLSSIAGMGHSMMFLNISYQPEEIADKILDLFINGMKG
ncbi:transcriptional regulator, TetR family [Desulfonispora thiosulfatigenes DSM 11270]|uniref:Transcriptional regulator, TetR family n=1 Tax=Desulfonispora thiosulfatigenes DSM 11270 TaxID=656914 RepID=A0A1W1V5L4_DESTI|nr:TetR/AcrR family transcriptional regulator [Desulfonispora thiosulfatigenes]SMB88450.1 transcriptional regulator, TetR family [Desulfonispora thiosulfatigenes DSM 11270]